MGFILILANKYFKTWINIACKHIVHNIKHGFEVLTKQFWYFLMAWNRVFLNSLDVDLLLALVHLVFFIFLVGVFQSRLYIVKILKFLYLPSVSSYNYFEKSQSPNRNGPKISITAKKFGVLIISSAVCVGWVCMFIWL